MGSGKQGEIFLFLEIKKNGQLFMGDGWLNREMVGKVREIGSAPACFGNSLGTDSNIFQKYKMGGITKGVASTL